jgi:hypothetical protein
MCFSGDFRPVKPIWQTGSLLLSMTCVACHRGNGRVVLTQKDRQRTNATPADADERQPSNFTTSTVVTCGTGEDIS